MEQNVKRKVNCIGPHKRPVHFNFGRKGALWGCFECGSGFAGAGLTEEEFEALKIFVDCVNAQESKKEKDQMAKLEIAVLIGAESKEFLAQLQNTVERLEKLKGVGAESEDAPEEKSVVQVKNGKVTSKTTTAKTALPADEEENFDLGEEGGAEEPAITKKDLIAACRENREAAIKALKKRKVASVHDLKPDQYSKFLTEIGA